MTYLSPLNRNNLDARSEIFYYISNQAFSDSTISNMKTRISDKNNCEKAKINAINNIAITAIACTAMVCLPKIAALGCAVGLTFAYFKISKFIKSKKADLFFTELQQKTIEYLSFPDLIEKALGFLNYYNHKNDFLFRNYIQDLEESSSKEKLWEKYKNVITLQEEIKRLFCLKKPPEPLLEELQLKDLTALINVINQKNSILREIQEILEPLEKEALIKPGFLSLHAKILTDQENLSKKLNVLQKNISFFKENGTFFLEVATSVLNIDRNFLNKARTCRDFIFCAFASAALIKANIFFIKQFKANWLDRGGSILNLIGHSTVIALGILSIGHVIINARKLMAYENDEAKKQTELATKIEDNKNRLDLLPEQA